MSKIGDLPAATLPLNSTDLCLVGQVDQFGQTHLRTAPKEQFVRNPVIDDAAVALAAIDDQIQSLNANISTLITVAADLTNINNVGGSIASVNAVAASLASLIANLTAIQNAATNATSASASATAAAASAAQIPPITISTTAPVSPSVNDIWIDIS